MTNGPTRIGVAVAATTCSSQWRRNARVLGSLPFHALGSLGPLPLVQDPRWFESTYFDTSGSWASFSSGCQSGGPSRPLRRMAGSRVAALWYGPPLSDGRRPLTHGPRREVASGPATPRVPTPRLVGDSWEWRCSSSRPCFHAAVRKMSLWVASPGDLSQLTLPSDRSLSRHPSVSGYSLPAWDCQRHHSLTDPRGTSTICTSRTRKVLYDDSKQAKSISLSRVSGVANERIIRIIQLLRQEVSFQYLSKSSCGSTCFVKGHKSDQPTWVPIMLSTCKVELEDVSGDARERHQTRR